MLGAGCGLIEVLSRLEITESTKHRWRPVNAGMRASDARWLMEHQVASPRAKLVRGNEQVHLSWFRRPVAI